MTENKPDKIGKLRGGFYLFGRGVISGVIAVFAVLGVFLFLIIPLDDSAFEILIFALLRGVVIGLPAGGIGGFMMGSIWKHSGAAIIGGIILALIALVMVFVAEPYLILGFN